MSLDLPLNNSEINFKANGAGANDAFEFEDFRLLPANLLLLKDGRQLPLTPKAVETLLALVERRGEVVTKDDLMTRIWPDAVVEESNLSQYLHVLRKTVGTMPDGRPFIETLKRRGYRFNAEVRLVSGTSPGAGTLAPNGVAASHAAVQVPSHGRSLFGPKILVLMLGFIVVSVGLFISYRAGWFDRKASESFADVISAPLTSGENVTQTTISHDGRNFAYVDENGGRSRLRLQAVDQSSGYDLLPAFYREVVALSFSPDDRFLYFGSTNRVDRRTDLFRVPATGGAPEKILEDVYQAVSFSPDGSEFVFVRILPDDTQRIEVAAADGSNVRKLLDSATGERISNNAAWSPDGRYVVFGSMTRSFPVYCSLVRLDLFDHSITPLTDEKWDSCYRIEFTSDGKGMAFVGTRYLEAFTTRRDQVYYLEFGASESRRLTNDGNWHDPTSLGITHSNDIIALPFSRVSQIWSVNADGDPNSAEQITQGQSDGRSGIVPTLDGKLAFLARDGDGIAIFETDSDGSNRRRVFGAPMMEELRSDTLTSFFVFARKEGVVAQLFRTDRNGGDLKQLTFGNSAKIDSTVSPDGKWIAYSDTAFNGTRVEQSLRKVSVDGGEPVVVYNKYCGTPHYSHDGRFITCSSDAKIAILAVETGEVVREFIAESTFVSNTGASWGPDDRDVIYRVAKNGATNLWRQPIDGGPAEPLTRFTKGDIYNFAYGPNGRKLFLSRGTVIRNAMMVKGFK